MNTNIFKEISNLIQKKKIDLAQNELSKLGPEFYKNSEYLYLRGKIFYIKNLYYIAIDSLLIALEYNQDDKIYDLISKIYETLGNLELSKKFSDIKLRSEATASLKAELSGIYRKEY